VKQKELGVGACLLVVPASRWRDYRIVKELASVFRAAGSILPHRAVTRREQGGNFRPFPLDCLGAHAIPRIGAPRFARGELT